MIGRWIKLYQCWLYGHKRMNVYKSSSPSEFILVSAYCPRCEKPLPIAGTIR